MPVGGARKAPHRSDKCSPLSRKSKPGKLSRKER